MSDQFLAEIRAFAFSYPPAGWALCNGQTLPIAQHTALAALLGTFYGGDGKETFGLPNLEGSLPVHPSDKAPYDFGYIGAQAGTETVTLLRSEIPHHSHQLQAIDTLGDDPGPAKTILARYAGAYQTETANLQPMALQSMSVAGSSRPHNNDMPYLVLNFCIALEGAFPQRP